MHSCWSIFLIERIYQIPNFIDFYLLVWNPIYLLIGFFIKQPFLQNKYFIELIIFLDLFWFLEYIYGFIKEKWKRKKRKTRIALLSPLTRVLAHTSRIPLWLTGGPHLSGLSSCHIVASVPSTAPLDLWPCPLASPCTANHPHSHPHSLSGKPTPTVVSSTQASPPSPLPVALRQGIITPPTLLCLPLGPYNNLWSLLSPPHLLVLSWALLCSTPIHHCAATAVRRGPLFGDSSTPLRPQSSFPKCPLTSLHLLCPNLVSLWSFIHHQSLLV